MRSTTRIVLRWWHIIFGIVALFFASQYLQDGFTEGGATSDRVKGYAWVALAILMVVAELMRRRKKDTDDAV